jgi:hypothetical protein
MEGEMTTHAESLPEFLTDCTLDDDGEVWRVLASQLRWLDEPYCLECGSRFPTLQAGMLCPNCGSRKPLASRLSGKQSNRSAPPQARSRRPGWPGYDDRP